MKLKLKAKEFIAEKILRSIFNLANLRFDTTIKLLFSERNKDRQIYNHIQQDIITRAKQQKRNIQFYTFENNTVAFSTIIFRYDKKRDPVIRQPVIYGWDGINLVMEAAETDFTDTFITRMLFVLCKDFQLLVNCDVEIERDDLKNTLKVGEWLAAYLYRMMKDKAGYNATIDELLAKD